jgi:hypothetical protein
MRSVFWAKPFVFNFTNWHESLDSSEKTLALYLVGPYTLNKRSMKRFQGGGRIMLNRRHLIGSVALLVVLGLIGGNNLCAIVVPCPTIPESLDVLIASFVGSANACSSSDKIFYNFSYTPGPSAPPAILVTADIVPGGPVINGWNFSSLWAQNIITGALANFTLSYTVEVCPAGDVPPCTQPDGFRITEADATDAPVTIFPPGNETVTWSPPGSPSSVTLTNGLPGPMASVFPAVLGPITVTANFTGTGAITQTSLRFFEAVPESATMVLLGIGLAGLGIIKGRRSSRD